MTSDIDIFSYACWYKMLLSTNILLYFEKMKGPLSHINIERNSGKL